MNFLWKIFGCCNAATADDSGSNSAPLISSEQSVGRDDEPSDPPPQQQSPNCQCAKRLDKIESNIRNLKNRLDYNDRQLDEFFGSGIQPTYSPNYIPEEEEELPNIDSGNVLERRNSNHDDNCNSPVQIEERPINKNSDNTEYYHINREKCRCLIYSHENFDNKKYEKRKGADEEAKRIQNSFKKLGFKVTIYKDNTYKKILNTLEKLKKESYEDGCICICISTHGSGGDLLMAKDNCYPSDIFMKALCAIPTLAGQPKLIFIQSCRGKKVDKGISLFRKNSQKTDEEIDTDTEDGTDKIDYIENPEKIPSQADLYIVHSTVPGHKSFREWFFPRFCEELDQSKEIDDIDLILRRTKNAISQYESQCDEPEDNEGKQVSTVVHTLRKCVYLKKM